MPFSIVTRIVNCPLYRRSMSLLLHRNLKNGHHATTSYFTETAHNTTKSYC